MARLVIMMALAFLLQGCSQDSSLPVTTPWSKEEIVGYRFDLVSSNKVEAFVFNKDGSVIATIGTRDGALCAPVFSWKLKHNGTLLIKDGHYSIELRRVATTNNVNQVLRNGIHAVYRVEKVK